MLQTTILSSTVNPSKIDISSNTSKLFFGIEYQSPAIGTLATSGFKAPEIMYFNLVDKVLAATRVTITRYSKKYGTVVLANNMLFSHLMEIAQCNEGRVSIKPADNMDDAEQDFIANFSVEVCNSGSLSLGPGDYLTVEISGMANYTLGALVNQVWKMKVYSYGAFNTVENEVLEYRAVTCQANQDVDIMPNGAYAIALPKDIIRAFFRSNHPTPDFLECTAAEVAAISADKDEVIYSFGGQTGNDFTFFTLPAAMTQSVRVSFPQARTVYLLSNKVLAPIG